MELFVTKDSLPMGIQSVKCAKQVKRINSFDEPFSYYNRLLLEM